MSRSDNIPFLVKQTAQKRFYVFVNIETLRFSLCRSTENCFKFPFVFFKKNKLVTFPLFSIKKKNIKIAKLSSVLRLCFIECQKQEIEYIWKKVWQFYNSPVFLKCSEIWNTNSPYVLHCFRSSIFCYQKCFSVNPFLECYQHFFKLSFTLTVTF